MLNQDTFYWGTLKGVGKVYVQVIVDVFCSLAFAKVYTAKMPVTTADTSCCSPWKTSSTEIQRDLDRFLRYYNLERSHQGYRLKGRTPAQALMEALAVSEIPDVIAASSAWFVLFIVTCYGK